MAYLLDANVFIEAKNRHYGIDFCPAFWDWLIERNAANRVFSIKRVEEDILKGSDELANWVRNRGPEFFLEPDEQMLAALPTISLWVSENKYTPAAISDFLSKSDYYLVAHALAHSFIVVTHEKHDGTRRKVKIPNVCVGVGVACVDTYAMLRAERAQFVLGGQ